jgi:hypothetical protein
MKDKVVRKPLAEVWKLCILLLYILGSKLCFQVSTKLVTPELSLYIYIYKSMYNVYNPAFLST